MDRNFRNFFATAKFFVRNRATWRRNPCRLVTRSLFATLRDYKQLCRVNACGRREIARDSERISDRNFRKFFAAAAKFRVRNRARSRRNPRCPTTPSLVASQRGPQTLCRASARCGACDFVRISADFAPKNSKNFRGRKILRSKSLEIAPESALPD